VSDQTRPSELDEVIEAARRLPLCDRSAKLHALLARLVYSVQTGDSLAPVADALASAASGALVDDPWVQFESAVRRFKAGHPLAPASLNPELVHEREGHGLRQRNHSHLD
jgi:hypothetical protein